MSSSFSPSHLEGRTCYFYDYSKTCSGSNCNLSTTQCKDQQDKCFSVYGRASDGTLKVLEYNRLVSIFYSPLQTTLRKDFRIRSERTRTQRFPKMIRLFPGFSLVPTQCCRQEVLFGEIGQLEGVVSLTKMNRFLESVSQSVQYDRQSKPNCPTETTR